jgi:hypothetical protein
VQCSWRLNSEEFIDSIIAAANKKSMLKNKSKRATTYSGIRREEKDWKTQKKVSKC